MSKQQETQKSSWKPDRVAGWVLLTLNVIFLCSLFSMYVIDASDGYYMSIFYPCNFFSVATALVGIFAAVKNNTKLLLWYSFTRVVYVAVFVLAFYWFLFLFDYNKGGDTATAAIFYLILASFSFPYGYLTYACYLSDLQYCPLPQLTLLTMNYTLTVISPIVALVLRSCIINGSEERVEQSVKLVAVKQQSDQAALVSQKGVPIVYEPLCYVNSAPEEGETPRPTSSL